ncbi:MAG TPA: hypothetical protein VG267_10050 [Terracidiphilus sp.]|jgi:hypothetical protein|nr:hypothetical protein [Terracidiphilus sp.]
MKTIAKVFAVALFIAFATPIGLWVGYTQLKGYSSNPLTYSSCITETEASLSNVAGWDFEVEDTNCDTLAKDEAVRVFAIRSDANLSSLTRLLARRRLVFQYDPWNQDELVPSITATGKNNILISIPRVSYIYKKNSLIGRTAVAYDIKKVEYP